MESTTDFDHGECIDNLTDNLVEAFQEDHSPGDDAHNTLTESMFEVLDNWMAFDADVQDAIGVLNQSPNEPEEWEIYAEGKDDWRDVVKAMAYTVVRQDVYDELERRGHLDAHWTPTVQLVQDNAKA